MPVYDRAIALADRLIAAKGATAVVLRAGTTSYDPVTQEEVATTVEHPFRAVELPPDRSAETRVGTLTGRHIIQLYFAQKDQPVRPRPGDTVRWAGHDWNVVWATTYDPAADGPIMTQAYLER